jgi:integration host factor subunit beta
MAKKTKNTKTKKELVDRIADDLNRNRPRSQIKRVQVKRVVQRFLDMIIEELAQGNRLEFREFGVFESKLRAARLAQNPKTLERVSVPPKRSVKFKVGRLMKEKMIRLSLEAAGGNHQPENTQAPAPAPAEQASVSQ